RYRDAGELADDLARFRRAEPVKARPLGPLGRAWKWCRRRPAVAALLLLVCLALSGGTTASTAFALRARAEAHRANESAGAERREREASQRALDDARAQWLRAERLRYAGQTSSAGRLWDAGYADLARQTLTETREDLRGWEYAYLDRVFNRTHRTF